MQITLNERTYTIGKVKTRMLRQAIELNEQINFNSIQAKDLDILVDFIVNLYGKQFTRDDLYDGLDADQLVPTINEAVSGIVGTMGEKLSDFPNK